MDQSQPTLEETTQDMIARLRAKRQLIDDAILALEGLGLAKVPQLVAGSPGPGVSAKPGRPSKSDVFDCAVCGHPNRKHKRKHGSSPAGCRLCPKNKMEHEAVRPESGVPDAAPSEGERREPQSILLYTLSALMDRGSMKLEDLAATIGELTAKTRGILNVLENRARHMGYHAGSALYVAGSGQVRTGPRVAAFRDELARDIGVHGSDE